MRDPRVTFDHSPSDAWYHPRREFLSRLLGGTAAAVVVPGLGYHDLTVS